MATQVVDVAVQSLGKMKGNIASGMDDILSVVGNLAEGEESFDGENLDALEEMLLDYTSMERTLKQFTAAVSEVKAQKGKSKSESLMSESPSQPQSVILDERPEGHLQVSVLLKTVGFSPPKLRDSDVSVEECKALLEAAHQDKKKDNYDKDLQSHSKVLEFRNKLQELREAQEEEEEEDEAGPSSNADQSLGEEELVMTQTEVGTKCPFTQQEMTNPVRNTICGHHYEKRGIDELLSKRKRFRCPLPGCNNKSFIVHEHLQPDQHFKKLLEKQRRANKRKQADSMYVD